MDIGSFVIILRTKTVDFSRIQTDTLGVEGKDDDH